MSENVLRFTLNKSKQYYPSCINETVTCQVIRTQLSIIKKIIYLTYRKQNISKQLCYNISSYVFSNPIKLQYPIYQKVRNNEIGYGVFLLYDRVNQKKFSIEIRKFWKKLNNWQRTKDKIMRFAIQFDDFMELRNYIMADQSEQAQSKWKLVSENNNQFHRLFQIIKKYKKDGVINQNVINAFNKIMSRNILITILHQTQQYIIIDSAQKKLQNSLQLKQKITTIALLDKYTKKKIHVGFNFEGQKMKLIGDDLQVYSMTESMTKRNKATYIDPQNFKEITMQDIYICE